MPQLYLECYNAQVSEKDLVIGSIKGFLKIKTSFIFQGMVGDGGEPGEPVSKHYCSTM